MRNSESMNDRSKFKYKIANLRIINVHFHITATTFPWLLVITISSYSQIYTPTCPATPAYQLSMLQRFYLISLWVKVPIPALLLIWALKTILLLFIFFSNFYIHFFFQNQNHLITIFSTPGLWSTHIHTPDIFYEVLRKYSDDRDWCDSWDLERFYWHSATNLQCTGAVHGYIQPGLVRHTFF